MLFPKDPGSSPPQLPESDIQVAQRTPLRRREGLGNPKENIHFDCFHIEDFETSKICFFLLSSLKLIKLNISLPFMKQSSSFFSESSYNMYLKFL